MQPPLVEVVVELQFDAVQLSNEKLQYFYHLNSDSLPESEGTPEDSPISISAESVKLASRRGVSFPALRSTWTPLLDSFLAIFSIHQLKQLSLSYQNEIPIEDLRSFRNYLNINFEMPETLKERVEFFRSEFTYKYPFGEIKVWLQPDWDEEMENYCVQLNLEARHIGNVATPDLYPAIQQLHEGIKDVFRQILSQDYIRSLPQ
ncbi:MAG TPA: hypothetical protein VJ521_08745 [Acidobacteriota bacterium]|nr:hypothetical protein [Acidobacteriota bacterium]